jgi:hypothetical protein
MFLLIHEAMLALLLPLISHVRKKNCGIGIIASGSNAFHVSRINVDVFRIL